MKLDKGLYKALTAALKAAKKSALQVVMGMASIRLHKSMMLTLLSQPVFSR